MEKIYSMFYSGGFKTNPRKISLSNSQPTFALRVPREIYPIERNKIQESPHNYIHHRLITEKFGYDSNSLFYKIITVRQILSYEETETKKRYIIICQNI